MSESRQRQELKDKVQDIVSKYEERLASVGIRIDVSKRYFEAAVGGRNYYSRNAGASVLIERHFNKERERKYKNERNKYHCIVISALPADKTLVRREYCKDYAFFLRKAERAHIGEKPQKITYEEDKLLRKIEKRILKIIKKAENHGVQKTCNDTVWDAVRYCSSSKYEYKDRVLGKERVTWDLIFTIAIGVFMVVFVLAGWGISCLF